MVVGNGVMPPLRLTAGTDTSEGGDEEGGTGGDHPPPFMDLPRLLATARHGDLSTLPPDQRHLLARMLLAGGVVPNVLMQRQALMRRRRLLLIQRRQLQLRQQQQQQQQASRVGTNDGFKQPELPLRHRLTKQASRSNYERYSRDVKPPTQRRSRERTPSHPNNVQRSSPPIQQQSPVERSSTSVAGRRTPSSPTSQQQQCPSDKTATITIAPQRSARERTPPDRTVEETPLPIKRFRSSALDQWVPVTPRTHSGSLQGLTSSYCSSSPSSSSLSNPPSQWRPVKVSHLGGSSFKNLVIDSTSLNVSIKSHTSLSKLCGRKISVDNTVSQKKLKLERSSSWPNSPESPSEPVPSASPSFSESKQFTPLRLNNNSNICSSTLSSDSRCHSLSVFVPKNANCFTPASSNCLGTAPPKYHWTNQLTRIFLQEVSEDAQEKEAETAEGSSDSSSNKATAANPSHSSAGSTVCSSSSSTENSANNKSSASQSTLAGSGMGNPFARAAPQATWGSESHDHRPIIAPSRLGPPSDTGTTKVSSSGGGSALRQPMLGGSRQSSSGKPPSGILSPPTLTVTGSSPPQASKTAFKLKPSVLGSSNPFLKTSNTEDSASGPDDEIPGTSEEISPHASKLDSSASSHTSPASGEREHSRLADSQTSSSNNVSKTNSSRNMFVPLPRNGEGNDSSHSPSLRNNSFIFGQNLQSKVTGTDSVTSSSDASATTNGERPIGNLFSEAASEISRSPDSAAATNGRLGTGTGNLFSDAALEILPPSEDKVWNSGQSLAESSRELAEKENSQKRKFDQVEVITGEENESNVLQMNCKLYAWVNSSWQERGRGILRLNDWDAGKIQSRLVIRTQGTLTVMLNTKVWAEMSVERAGNKSVRFTALDADGQPKIFLAMGSPKDVDLLYNSLEWRVAASRSQASEEGGDSDSNKKVKKEETGATSVTR